MSAALITLRRVAMKRAAFVVVIGPRRSASGVEVACNHNADGFHPAGYIEHRMQTAFSHNIIVVHALPLAIRWQLADGFLDTKKIEPLVIFVIRTGNRCKIIMTPAGKSVRRPQLAVAPATVIGGAAARTRCTATRRPC